MAELSEAINLDEIAVGLPSRIHEVTAGQVARAPDAAYSKNGTAHDGLVSAVTPTAPRNAAVSTAYRLKRG